MARDAKAEALGEGVEVIYRMTIRTKSGKVIRRPCGRPFRIVIKRQRKS